MVTFFAALTPMKPAADVRASRVSRFSMSVPMMLTKTLAWCRSLEISTLVTVTSGAMRGSFTSVRTTSARTSLRRELRRGMRFFSIVS